MRHQSPVAHVLPICAMLFITRVAGLPASLPATTMTTVLQEQWLHQWITVGLRTTVLPDF
jgi:hypothetical protein